MDKAFLLMEKLMARDDRISRLAIENVLKLAIPFNTPHRFHIERLNSQEVQIRLPNRRVNHNHLGGIHACAIATLGEFCAGLTLARHLGFTRYRFILAELRVTYHRQGRTPLLGVSRLSADDAQKIREDLSLQEKILFPHQSSIQDEKGESVADVYSVWQVKDWQKVKLK
jgi:acyl-coenzyme A thioesterase PaaI-like protein